MSSNVDVRLEEQVGSRTDRRVIRTYRLRPAQLLFVTLVLGLPGIPLVRSFVLADDAPLTFRVGMLVLISPVYLFLIWFWRAATIVYEDHIAVRQLFRTRRTAWSDVLSIETDSNPGSSRTRLLTREGRLIALQGGVGLRGGVGAPAREVRFITDVWERVRGEEWTPPTEATVLAAHHRAGAWESAIISAGFLAAGSFLPLFVSGLVLSARSGRGDIDEEPLFQVIGFVPVVVFIAVYQVAFRLLRRRHPGHSVH